MPVTNPCCCGCSLQTGTQIVAIVNIVLASIASLLLSLAIFGYGVVAIVGTENLRNSHPESFDKKYDQVPDQGVVVVALVVTSVMLIVVIFRLITNIVLLVGANQRHYGKCRFWFIVSLISLVLFVLKSSVETVEGGVAGGFALVATNIFGFLIGLAIEGYLIWIVHAFMEELKEEGPGPAAGYVHGPGVPPQAYIYTMQADGHDNLPPSYSQTQEGYVVVPLNKPQGPGYPAASGYPPQAGFYPKLDAEMGQNY